MTYPKARIASSNFLIAFDGQTTNLLDQVGGELENPHWRGERITPLPLSAFLISPPILEPANSIISAAWALLLLSYNKLMRCGLRTWSFGLI